MQSKPTYENNHAYDNILHLPHHVSRSHPHMSRTDRAAQFSPFAALTGYKEAIEETERRTENRIDLEEDMKIILDEKLRRLRDQTAEHPQTAITYFLPDKKKDGGAYVTLHDRIKKIDNYRQILVMQDGTEIPIADIVEIEWEKIEPDPLPAKYGCSHTAETHPS